MIVKILDWLIFLLGGLYLWRSELQRWEEYNYTSWELLQARFLTHLAVHQRDDWHPAVPGWPMGFACYYCSNKQLNWKSSLTKKIAFTSNLSLYNLCEHFQRVAGFEYPYSKRKRFRIHLNICSNNALLQKYPKEKLPNEVFVITLL